MVVGKYFDQPLEEKIKDAGFDIKFSEDLGWKMGLGGASFEVRTAGSIVS